MYKKKEAETTKSSCKSDTAVSFYLPGSVRYGFYVSIAPIEQHTGIGKLNKTAVTALHPHDRSMSSRCPPLIQLESESHDPGPRTPLASAFCYEPSRPSSSSCVTRFRKTSFSCLSRPFSVLMAAYSACKSFSSVPAVDFVLVRVALSRQSRTYSTA